MSLPTIHSWCWTEHTHTHTHKSRLITHQWHPVSVQSPKSQFVDKLRAGQKQEVQVEEVLKLIEQNLLPKTSDIHISTCLRIIMSHTVCFYKSYYMLTKYFAYAWLLSLLHYSIRNDPHNPFWRPYQNSVTTLLYIILSLALFIL